MLILAKKKYFPKKLRKIKFIKDLEDKNNSTINL